ncbi:NAD-dependent epimerase/dehydratase family protein [Shouchella patagoniensis]|uniref:NAD-dependent epimerase/dehydratase family protein n=1 Tax=Shouchella patagoniensis TaxID=228576 RepID=UPI00099508DE|nr:NAD-dependent epimerase/dehydratase family protein [Shouchella patagoniensis]
MNKLKVLVLGGTRFLGKHIVEELINRNHDVTIFNRGNHPVPYSNVIQLTGDRDGNLEELRGKEWDCSHRCFWLYSKNRR